MQTPATAVPATRRLMSVCLLLSLCVRRSQVDLEAVLTSRIEGVVHCRAEDVSGGCGAKYQVPARPPARPPAAAAAACTRGVNRKKALWPDGRAAALNPRASHVRVAADLDCALTPAGRSLSLRRDSMESSCWTGTDWSTQVRWPGHTSSPARPPASAPLLARLPYLRSCPPPAAAAALLLVCGWRRRAPASPVFPLGR